MQGVRARFDTELPPFISAVRHPDRLSTSGMEWNPLLHEWLLEVGSLRTILCCWTTFQPVPQSSQWGIPTSYLEDLAGWPLHNRTTSASYTPRNCRGLHARVRLLCSRSCKYERDNKGPSFFLVPVKTYTVGGGEGKQGRFVILPFPLLCSVWGSQDTQMLGKTARKVSLSHPFLGVPQMPAKTSTWEQRRQAQGKGQIDPTLPIYIYITDLHS